MTFTDNRCSGANAIGTMVLRAETTDLIETLTISDSSFIDNSAPKGSAISSSLAVSIILSDVSIIGNETTEQDGFIFLQNHPVFERLFVTIKNGHFSENKTLNGFGGIYVQNLITTEKSETSLKVQDSVISNN